MPNYKRYHQHGVAVVISDNEHSFDSIGSQLQTAIQTTCSCHHRAIRPAGVDTVNYVL